MTIDSEVLQLSESLNVDKKLILSCENLLDEIRGKIKVEKLSIDAKLKAARAFPTAAVLATFSLKVYESLEGAEMPDGWMLLTTAANKEIANGYFGAAFWHPEQHRVIIAHRGTELNNLGAVVADIVGIVGNNCGGQMESACTFSDQVVQSMQTVERENEDVHFDLFFTGHSLGAWLAQVSTFSNEFLKTEGETFVRRDQNDPEPYHAQSIVFDSPGCLPMLRKLQKKFGNEEINLDDLSMTSFLSAPNKINTCNEHFGKVFRIFVETSNMNLLDRNLGYTLTMHSIDNIVKVFQCDKSFFFLEVIEWPIREGLTNTQQLENFLKLADHRNRYHLREEIRSRIKKVQVRYKTREVDETSCPINIFTRREQKFLEYFRWIRCLPEFKSFEHLFEEIKSSDEIIENLSLFEIVDSNLRFKNPEHVKQFVPRVKLLLRVLPKIAETVQKLLSDPQVRGKALAFETMLCLEDIKDDLLDFKSSTVDWPTLMKHQISQVKIKTGKARTGLSMVYKTFAKSEDKTSEVFVFNMKRFVIVNELIDFKGLLSTTQKSILLILYSEDSEFLGKPSFENFLDALKEHQQLKVVMVGKTDDQIHKVVKLAALEKFESRFYEIEKSFNWNDLTNESQKRLLDRAIRFQGRDEPLGNLICSRVELDDEVLLQLLNNESLEINVDPLALCDFSAVVVDHDKREIKAKHVLESLENSEDIFVVSGLYDDNQEILLKSLEEILKVEDLKQQELIVKNLDVGDESIDAQSGKLHLISLVGSEKCCLEDFDEKCREFKLNNIDRSIHLLKIRDGKLSWRKSYNFCSFIERRLKVDSRNISVSELSDKKLVAIVGQNGEGKSTFLSKFAQDKLKDSWLIYLNFNDISFNADDWSHESLANFAMKAARYQDENHLQTFALRYKIKNTTANPIHFCFDGFDEIESGKERDRVVKLLKFIKEETKCFVTLSLHESALRALTDLHPFVCTLEKLSQEEKETLLRNYWRSHFALVWGPQKCAEIFDEKKNSKFKSFSKILFDQLDSSMDEKAESSMGIALQLRLLAEGFQEDFEKFIQISSMKQKILEGLKIKTFYQHYVSTKYDLYVTAKTQVAAIDQKGKSLFKTIKNASIDSLIPKNLWTCNSELFSADFVIMQLTKGQSPPKLLATLTSYLLTDPRCENLRAYLEKHEELLPRSAAFEINDEIVNAILSSPVTTSCKEGRAKILEFLIEVLKKKKDLKNVKLAHDDTKKTALNYAIENNNESCFKLLIEFLVQHGDEKALLEGLENIGKEALIKFAMNSDDEDFSEWLKNFMENNLVL